MDTQSTTERERSAKDAARRAHFEARAEACLRIAEGLRDLWRLRHDHLTEALGGGPPWAAVNVPEGSRYLSGGTWSHWPELVRDELRDLDGQRVTWEDRARQSWMWAGHTVHTFAAWKEKHSRPAA